MTKIDHIVGLRKFLLVPQNRTRNILLVCFIYEGGAIPVHHETFQLLAGTPAHRAYLADRPHEPGELYITQGHLALGRGALQIKPSQHREDSSQILFVTIRKGKMEKLFQKILSAGFTGKEKILLPSYNYRGDKMGQMRFIQEAKRINKELEASNVELEVYITLRKGEGKLLRMHGVLP